MYTYGRPQYLAKIITTRSYNEWKGEHFVDLETQLKNNISSLKGYYVPNLWLGNGNMFSFNKSWNGVDYAVKKLIAACYCDYMAVKKAFATSLSEPTIEGIKRDIQELIFDRYSSRGIKEYKAFFDKRYEFVIKNIRNEVIDNWNGQEPSDEIKNFFSETSYHYKKRNRASKWSWMKDMTVMQIAKKLISTGIDKLTGAIISALKHLHISVKSVIEALESIMDEMSEEDRQKTIDFRIKHEWFTSLTVEQKDRLMEYVGYTLQPNNGGWDWRNLATTIIRAFKAPKCIFKYEGSTYWGPTVGEYYKRVTAGR